VPTFDVTIQGKTYRIEIPDPGATPLQIIVDGQPFEVGIVGTEAAARPQKPAVPPQPASEPPPLPHLPAVVASRPATPAGAVDDGAIIAPLPGTILSIAVNVGQRVEAGQVLCVLEAMKMKNPIRATHAGTVAEVAIETGQTVAYGDLLVRLA